MKIKYLVEHVAEVGQSVEVPHDGGTATMTFNKLRVELIPVGHSGSTITLVLPVGTTGYVEGETIDVSFPGKAE